MGNILPHAQGMARSGDDDPTSVQVRLQVQAVSQGEEYALMPIFPKKGGKAEAVVQPYCVRHRVWLRSWRKAMDHAAQNGNICKIEGRLPRSR